MVFKNNRSNPRGKQKARPNSMQYVGFCSCKHLHIYAQLLWTQHVCSRTWSCWLAAVPTQRWTAARSRMWWRDEKSAWICIWMLFIGDIFKVLLSKITCTKVLQYALPKSCMWKCSTVQKLRWRRLLKASATSSLISERKVDFPQVWVCICWSPPLWLGSLNKSWDLGSHHVPFPHHNLAGLSLSQAIAALQKTFHSESAAIYSRFGVGWSRGAGWQSHRNTAPLKGKIPIPASQGWNLVTSHKHGLRRVCLADWTHWCPRFQLCPNEQLGEV